MSPVKQIVKASITSLWRSRAEFVPTARDSCTLSCEWDRPTSQRGSPLPQCSPQRWGNSMVSCETPSRKTKWLLSAPYYLPKKLPSARKPALHSVQGWRKLPASAQSIPRLPPANNTLNLMHGPCGLGTLCLLAACGQSPESPTTASQVPNPSLSSRGSLAGALPFS